MPITRQRSKSDYHAPTPDRRSSNSPPGPRSLDPPSTSPGPTDRRITRSLSRARSASANHGPSHAVRPLLFSGVQPALAELSTSSSVSRGPASRVVPANPLAFDSPLPAPAPEQGSFSVVGGAAREAHDRSTATPNQDRRAARGVLDLAKKSLSQQLLLLDLRLIDMPDWYDETNNCLLWAFKHACRIADQNIQQQPAALCEHTVTWLRHKDNLDAIKDMLLPPELHDYNVWKARLCWFRQPDAGSSRQALSLREWHIQALGSMFKCRIQLFVSGHLVDGRINPLEFSLSMANSPLLSNWPLPLTCTSCLLSQFGIAISLVVQALQMMETML